ncbi:MAG TPA: hypothetical protein VJ464_15915 [Blastocatellia bacterium]|nr:hypothetical protein [Blastocatellia bacterium]
MEALKDLTPYAATLAVFVIIVRFILPHWKAVRLDDNKVRLAELEVRIKEAEVRQAEATSIGRLTDVFKQSSEATEELKIMLRAVITQHRVIEARVLALETKSPNPVDQERK